MKKVFGSNLGTMLVYGIISIVLIGISSLGFLFESEFNFYPLVITAISFVFGAIYLFASLISMNKKIQLSDSKGMNVLSMMGSNFLRFLILILSVASSFLFIYFGPRTGEIEKWVYLLILISGVPMFVNIGLFYLRGKYVE